MAQKTMYPAQISSPGTELAAAATAEATEIMLLDASKLPDAPNLATIGSDETAEVVLYTGKDSNKLTGVTRGFQGAAKSWSTGARVARYFTAYDHDTFLANVLDLAASKQDVLRLADNYLAASVLVNAAPDAQGRAYPRGVSMFKVSTTADGWPAANGYVLTLRAGGDGYQMFLEMYTGATQTDKTFRHWERSKKDNNPFWQDWVRIMTEVDRDAILADYIRQPGYAVTTGTGAAYTVSLNPAPATLPDGFGITIVPHAANTAVDPTLQVGSLAALPIRRQNGATFTAGSIKSGAPLALIKVGSYFLARSVGATGTATAAQVRAGATFSNESNVDLVGTLPVQATAAQTVIPGTTDQVKAAGIYDGAITVKGDSNLVAANIVSGKTMFGVSGTAKTGDPRAGDTQIFSGSVYKSDVPFQTYTKIVGFTIKVAGVYRTKLVNVASSDGATNVSLRFFVNGVAVGVNRAAGPTATTYVEDFTLAVGDVLELKTYQTNGNRAVGTINICLDLPDYFTYSYT